MLCKIMACLILDSFNVIWMKSCSGFEEFSPVVLEKFFRLEVPENLILVMRMLAFQVSRAVRNAYWDQEGANKVSSVLRTLLKYSYIARIRAKFSLIFKRMSSILADRREVNVRGEGNNFYRAMTLAVDKILNF